jgi:hypothetical protein
MSLQTTRLDDLRKSLSQDTTLHPFDLRVLDLAARYLAASKGDQSAPLTSDEKASLKLFYEQLLGLPFDLVSPTEKPRAVESALETTAFKGQGQALGAETSSEQQSRENESINERRRRFLQRFSQP